MPKKYPAKVRDRAVRIAMDRLSEHPAAPAYEACKARAPKLDVGSETLRRWLEQGQGDAGEKDGATADERDLKEANEILKEASTYFAGELYPHSR